VRMLATLFNNSSQPQVDSPQNHSIALIGPQ